MKHIITILFTSLLLSGCGAWQAIGAGTSSAYKTVFHKKIKTLRVALSGNTTLNTERNASESEVPLSVLVRVYQISDRKIFDSASYDDLLENDRAVLAPDLRASASAFVMPGGTATITQAMDDDTAYIAVIAFFRDTQSGAAWRQVFAKNTLSPKKPLTLQLKDHELSRT